MYFFLVAFACLLALAVAASVRAGYVAGRRGRLAAGRAGERRVAELLDLSCGQDRLDDVVIGPSPRKSAQIDHLVRGVRRLVVIETKNWSGTLSGEAADGEWFLTRANGDRVTLRNPLRQAARQARVVERATGEAVEVVPLVVMAGRARFEAGAAPEGIISARDLPRVLPGILQGGSGSGEALEAAWGELVEDAFAPDADRRSARYVAWLESRFGQKPWRSWLVLALALAALAWTMTLCLATLGPRAA